MKRDGRKIVLALLLNFFLIGVGLFVLDTLKIISIGQVLESLGFRKGYIPRIEDPNLLEKSEMKKQWKLLALKEMELKKTIGTSKKKEQELKDLRDRLLAIQKNLKEREKRIKQDSLDKTKRSERIRKVAIQYMNMPPEKAVARIQAMTDDLLIIEILRAMDAESARRNQQSMVPYYLSLMEKKRAAVIQRKMANISTMKNTDF